MSGVARQLRGSSLLLGGRLLSKFLNFGIQVAIVRLLTKDDYGAFAYGLALALSGELVVKFGLGRGANRFVPLYAERGQRGEVLGTLALVCATIIALGCFCFGGLWWLAEAGWGGFPRDEAARHVVLILAVLAPVQALDTICIQTLACFSRPRAIFFRKHVLGPGLRAGAVAVAFASGGGSETLAYAYLAGGVIGLVICVRLAVRELHSAGVLPLPIAQWRLPLGELLRFSLPLITSDLVFITVHGVTTALLLALSSESAVASMRAVVPAAQLNMLVQQSFALLFAPAAMRLFAQDDLAGLREHHWRSTAWVGVLSFPIFALTFGVAPTIVPLVFGESYRDSAPLLAMMAAGHYLQVALGFNGQMLEVQERTRAMVWANLATVVLGIGLALLLIPRFGALGAAISISLSLLGLALSRHLTLLWTTQIGPVPASQHRIWASLFVGALATAACGWIWPAPIWAQIAIAALVSLALLRFNATALDFEQSFPELRKLPLLAKLVGTRA